MGEEIDAPLLDAFQKAPLGIAQFSPDGRFLKVNHYVTHLLGYTEAELLGLSVWDVTPPEDREASRASMATLARGEQETFELEKSYLRKDGTLFRGLVTVGAVRDETGELLHLVAFLRDIGDLVEARRKHRASEDLFQRIFDQQAMGIVFSRPGGQLVRWNPRFEEMFGFSREELRDMSWQDLTHPDDLGKSLEANRKVRGGDSRSYSLEKRYRTRDGEVVWALVTISPLVGEDGRVDSLVAFLQDISEQVRLREKLGRTRRLEALGTLAGGVAHDFNNRLSVILSAAEILEEELGEDSPLASWVEQILRSASRSGDLIRKILTFSRRKILEARVADLDKLVRDLHDLLVKVLPEGIELMLRGHPAPLPVEVEVAQIEQVLLNLVLNARDAMPSGGCLEIEVSRRQVGAEEATPHGCSPGEYACVEVRDEGRGISPGDLPRIFEPYFTTKPVGEGTGLGLATAHGAVSLNGGWIHVESRPEHGSRFEVLLPLVQGEIAGAEEPQVAVDREGARATILLVEDEPDLRQTVTMMLERAGYRVLAAEHGARALELAGDLGQPMDLVVSDVVMPVLDGARMARELRALRPSLPVLYLSGYAGDTLATWGLDTESIRLLPKPFTRAALLEQVRTLLS